MSEKLFAGSVVDDRKSEAFCFEIMHVGTFSRSAYILKVCTQRMCPRVPVPLSPLLLHPPLPLAEAAFSEPGDSEEFHILGIMLDFRVSAEILSMSKIGLGEINGESRQRRCSKTLA